MENSEITTEQGAKADDPVFKCTRSFFLPICDGPHVAVPKGALVRLKPETAHAQFYCSKVEPVSLPESAQFEILHELRTVSPEGTYLTLYRGDVVQMTPDEAFPYLRQRLIKAVNFNLFGGTNYEVESTKEFLAPK